MYDVSDIEGATTRMQCKNKYQYKNDEIFTANLDCCVLFFSEASVRYTCFAHAVLFFWVVSTILALLQTCVFVSLCKGCL